MTPPHLPPKTSNVEQYRMWQRLKLLLAAAIFSLIVGASGASIMLGWIWPRFAEGDSWIASYNRPALSRAQLEDRVREEIADRVVAVYKGSSAIGDINYLNKKIGDGIMISSDGWLALYQPQYDNTFKNTLVSLRDGSIYQVQNAVWDAYSGILYLKIQNEQFKVVGFVEETDSLDEVFVWQDSNWYHSTVLYPTFNYKIPHVDTAPIGSYSINNKFKSGSVAINNQGRVVGFVSDDNTLLPSVHITRVLAKVLSEQKVEYPSLGVEGWFSEEQVLFAAPEDKSKAGEQLQGFLVANVLAPSSALRKGDVILQINGRIVFWDNLWYVISNNETVNAVVLRGGKEIELPIKVIQTK